MTALSFSAYIADLYGTNYPCDELAHMRVLEHRRGLSEPLSFSVLFRYLGFRVTS